MLTNVVAKWPGSSHNSFIVSQSCVGRRRQAGAVPDGWLLGKMWLITDLWQLCCFHFMQCKPLNVHISDSQVTMGMHWSHGYQRHLQTPRMHNSAQQTHYNVVHSCVRSVVECYMGLLKGGWLYLDATGGRLLNQPGKVWKTLRACAVLHNLAMRNAVPFPTWTRQTWCTPPPLNPMLNTSQLQQQSHCALMWCSDSKHGRSSEHCVCFMKQLEDGYTFEFFTSNFSVQLISLNDSLSVTYNSMARLQITCRGRQWLWGFSPPNLSLLAGGTKVFIRICE